MTQSVVDALAQIREGFALLEQTLQQQEARSADPLRDGPPVLYASEAAELLRCDEATVYRMAKSGKLPSLRVGNSARGVRILRAALLEWIERQNCESAPAASPRGRRLRTVGGRS